MADRSLFISVLFVVGALDWETLGRHPNEEETITFLQTLGEAGKKVIFDLGTKL